MPNLQLGFMALPARRIDTTKSYHWILKAINCGLQILTLSIRKSSDLMPDPFVVNALKLQVCNYATFIGFRHCNRGFLSEIAWHNVKLCNYTQACMYAVTQLNQKTSICEGVFRCRPIITSQLYTQVLMHMHRNTGIFLVHTVIIARIPQNVKLRPIESTRKIL
jgi:hypothetical protein